MEVYSYSHLLELLPNCENLFPLKNGSESSPVEVRYISESEANQLRNYFVPPRLPVMEPESPSGGCQIIIVSAPGAVGKSTLSRSIAAEKDAMLYDLADARPVGGASLSGTLFNALGGENSDQFAEYLKEGFQFVIVDALDEGRIRVTQDAFLSFLEDIRSQAQDAKQICFVLLGRTQIAEEAWLTLDGDTSGARLLEIEPFSRLQAEDYINGRVEDVTRTPVFDECRDLIFQQLAFSTGNSDSDESREFLHYPPVLDVIVELLEGEPNLQSLRNDLQAQPESFGTESLDLLENVIARILEREQKEKFLPTIISKFGERAQSVAYADWDELYSPDEQAQRLVGEVLDLPVANTPSSLPPELKDEYEEAVRELLLLHPFLQRKDRPANSVFQSYLYARALRGDFGDEVCLRATSELLRLERLSLRTRMLAEFYFSGDPTCPDAIQKIAPEHLGILYDSLLSSETTRSHLRLTVDGTAATDMPLSEDLEQVEGDFEFVTISSEGQVQGEPRLIPFLMQIGSDSHISFTRTIRNCNITLPCTIELGSSSAREFELGPAVFINAGKLRFASESLKVGGRRRPRPDEEDEGNVILEALECDYAALINRPTVYEADRFFVSWPNADSYPWTEFQFEELADGFSDEGSLHTTFMRFRRIATSFRSNGHGALAKTARKIDHHRLLQGDIGKELLEQLVTDGVLLREGGFYHWNSSRADALLGLTGRIFVRESALHLCGNTCLASSTRTFPFSID